jgi:hypothetical protein
MFANLILKQTLLEFWSRFGDKKSAGIGFDPIHKLNALIELSSLVIPYKKQTELEKRRQQFNEAKATLHKWKRFGFCFVCLNPATARHHIVQLQNGGINSRKNIVSLCDSCHTKIHPWL